ncbi:xanthine dehydrogenase accessory protein XdhC [Neotabrizicola shimadae]|uniref:Xanthine dehydrogenase accessory protein XdhC n=1 Tax=Neotabrizicola shimadae TaxID=2807096 RepID=A0A8G0ZW20_9RHOB|nr:xanthine dehydrogenase accessory protein XdhC [Neotabrizicola shimadae]QYZ70460.1 xanthine dehydrogenase accessory protein XdhC [Neotabrizicola shimadae]
MFDLAALTRAVARHGRVARVVIAAHDGSSPRETGAAMLVWDGGQEGTIGGGALEWEATTRARALLAQGGRRVDRQALGPNLGQCCGGAVTVLTEVHDPATLPVPQSGLIARAVDGRPLPLAVARLLDRARAEGARPGPLLLQGWFIEPLAEPTRDLWIWGAGHVGRALVGVIAPLPGTRITWVDVAPDRFPPDLPETVTPLALPDPAEAVAEAPATAEHLILTYSHALDLELCHRLLTHGFAACGLIGSATKWARFRSRLAALGHTPDTIVRITCPIGDPALGKHPQAIAIGVAARFLSSAPANAAATEAG